MSPAKTTERKKTGVRAQSSVESPAGKLSRETEALVAMYQKKGQQPWHCCHSQSKARATTAAKEQAHLALYRRLPLGVPF